MERFEAVLTLGSSESDRTLCEGRVSVPPEDELPSNGVSCLLNGPALRLTRSQCKKGNDEDEPRCPTIGC